LDFIWGLNAPAKCYNDIINMIKSDGQHEKWNTCTCKIHVLD
jgi:hypothetical protein